MERCKCPLSLFVTLGAATNPEAAALQTITGFFLGLSKRPIEVS